MHPFITPPSTHTPMHPCIHPAVVPVPVWTRVLSNIHHWLPSRNADRRRTKAQAWRTKERVEQLEGAANSGTDAARSRTPADVSSGRQLNSELLHVYLQRSTLTVLIRVGWCVGVSHHANTPLCLCDSVSLLDPTKTEKPRL